MAKFYRICTSEGNFLITPEGIPHGRCPKAYRNITRFDMLEYVMRCAVAPQLRKLVPHEAPSDTAEGHFDIDILCINYWYTDEHGVEQHEEYDDFHWKWCSDPSFREKAY